MQLAKSLALAALVGAMNLAHAVPATIEMENKAGKVVFTHDKHSALADVDCGDCHHMGMEKTCHDCHPKGAAGPVFNAREALHRQCIGCHKRDEEAGKATGPTKDCKGCHLR